MLITLAISGVIILASAIGTIAGFGTATIVVPIFLLIFPLPQTLLLGGIIHWFNDLARLGLFRAGIRWTLIAAFGIPGIFAAIVGARMAFLFPADVVVRAIGAVLVIYGGFLFWRPRFQIPQRVGTAIAGGALSGFLAGVSGIGGAVRSAVLSVFDLPKAAFIATVAAAGFLIDTARLATYVWSGAAMDRALAENLLFYIPASFAGVWIGERILQHIPQERFRFIVAAFLVLVGIKFAFFP